MSQAAATPCMSEPMFEARAASQSARKIGRASGPQAELERVVVSAVRDLVEYSEHVHSWIEQISFYQSRHSKFPAAINHTGQIERLAPRCSQRPKGKAILNGS
jgi:hypothetical protein